MLVVVPVLAAAGWHWHSPHDPASGAAVNGAWLTALFALASFGAVVLIFFLWHLFFATPYHLWQEERDRPPAGPALPAIPKRDTPLDKALVYAVTGAWEDQMLDGQQMIDDLTVRLREFEQAARDNELLVWGKEVTNGVPLTELWELIEPDFWKNHRVNWFSLVLEDHVWTETYKAGDHGVDYTELKVSRAQFEEKWPHG